MHNINITYWNINNYKSKQFGNNLCDPDFISACQNSHIVALGETHTTTADELTIPGFGKPYLNHNKILSKHKKAYGGLAVFVKNDLLKSKAIKHIKRDNKDIIWIKLNHKILKTERDIYIGAVYLRPQNRTNLNSTEKTLESLKTDVTYFQSRAQVVLNGDFIA
jgi:hypothetical protein